MCNHENNACAPLGYHHNEPPATRASVQVHELPQGQCGDSREGTDFMITYILYLSYFSLCVVDHLNDYLYIYIYIYIYIYSLKTLFTCTFFRL